HINRMVFQALAGNPTLQLLVAAPNGVYTDEGQSDPIQGSAEGRSLYWAESPAAQLAQVPDGRISVLSGPIARFGEFADRVLPETGESDDAQQAINSELSRNLLGRREIGSGANV